MEAQEVMGLKFSLIKQMYEYVNNLNQFNHHLNQIVFIIKIHQKNFFYPGDGIHCNNRNDLLFRLGGNQSKQHRGQSSILLKM